MTRTTKLLIIDDDDAFRARLAKSFETRGYQVREACSLSTMRLLCQDFEPTHAVVDLCMPGESGLDAVAFLVDRYTTRVVVLTGYSSVPTALEAVRRGAANYLSKPVAIDELIQGLFGPALSPVGSSAGSTKAATLSQVEWEHIQRVLRDCQGNITHAAKKLGLHRQALQRKLRGAVG